MNVSTYTYQINIVRIEINYASHGFIFEWLQLIKDHEIKILLTSDIPVI